MSPAEAQGTIFTNSVTAKSRANLVLTVGSATRATLMEMETI